MKNNWYLIAPLGHGYIGHFFKGSEASVYGRTRMEVISKLLLLSA